MDKFSLMSARTGAAGRTVGLDIGSSAVRAVELAGTLERRELRAFAQVGLPRGAVVEGEIHDPEVVAKALVRLWAEAGFSTRKVVTAVGGQRVIVREAEVTAMSAADFRSAINFEVQDLIPIPVADALLDFEILGPGRPAPDGRERMRILLAAADRQTVDGLLRTLREASLEPVGIDVASCSMLRAMGVPSAEVVGLVNIGADLTNVSIRTSDGGLLSRTLTVGADNLTKGVGVRLGVNAAEAEYVKRYATSGEAGARRASLLVAEEARPLIDQIVESLDYFQSQSGIPRLGALWLSGGGALAAEVPQLLSSATGHPVALVDPFAQLDLKSAPLGADELVRSRPVALCAVGLAEWASLPAERRLSLLPPEVLEARRERKAMVASAAAIGVLCLGLGGLFLQKHHQVNSVQSETRSVAAEGAAARVSAASLGQVSNYFSTVDTRQRTLSALAAGIDLPALVRVISAAMPSNFTLSSISIGAAPSTGSTTGGSSAATAAASQSATVSMAVKARGGVESVAQWLRAMSQVPALTNVFVGSSTTDGTTTSFQCQATTTANAPKTTYSWEIKK